MGGCATKPKVFKADDKAEFPAPATPTEEVPAAKVAAFAADGEKKVETDEVAKDKDAVVDGNIDDQSNKRSRSLSNLFKQKETEATTETETDNNTPSETETAKRESLEPLKQQSVEAMKTEAVEAVGMNQETKESEKPMAVSGFPETIESAQPIEVKPAPEAAVTTTAASEAVNVPETQSKETPTDETKDKTVVEN